MNDSLRSVAQDEGLGNFAVSELAERRLENRARVWSLREIMAPPPSITVSSQHHDVEPGTEVTIQWSGQHLREIRDGAGNEVATFPTFRESEAGTKRITFLRSTTYELTALSKRGSATGQWRVNVVAPPDPEPEPDVEDHVVTTPFYAKWDPLASLYSYEVTENDLQLVGATDIVEWVTNDEEKKIQLRFDGVVVEIEGRAEDNLSDAFAGRDVKGTWEARFVATAEVQEHIKFTVALRK